jgi:hypothetical protein
MATITDNFNTADSDTMGAQLTWAEVVSDWDNFQNGAALSPAGGADFAYARAESDLDTDDHYAQVKEVHTANSSSGPACRFAAAATTCYLTANFGGVQYLYKSVAGTETELGNGASTWAQNRLTKIEANDTAIKVYIDGAQVVSVTDSSISGNTRCGMAAFYGSAKIHDDFEAADLGGGGGGTAVPVFRHHYRLMRR